MERPQTKSNGSKDYSSEEEGDFESADEGEENENSQRSFTATSSGGDDEECSTSNICNTQMEQRDPAEAVEKTNVEILPENTTKVKESEVSLDSEQEQEKQEIYNSENNKGNSPTSGVRREREITSVESLNKSEMANCHIQPGIATDNEIQSKKDSQPSEKSESATKLQEQGNELSLQPLSSESGETADSDGGVQSFVLEGGNSKPFEAIVAGSEVEQKTQLSARNEKVVEDKSSETKCQDTEAKTVDEDPVPSNQAGGSWGWGGWGSLLSQATSTVSTGLSSMIETVETSLGVPDPEQMAQKVRDDERKAQELVQSDQPEDKGNIQKGSTDNSGCNSLFSSFGVAGLTSMVESRSMNLVTGGLGALEFIGKKTMDVISDGDQGLRRKRQLLSGKGESLSQILRQAKEDSEESAMKVEACDSLSPMMSYSTEFDQYQGLAHLEALEILSRQSSIKLESQMIDMEQETLTVAKPLLRAIEEVFQISEEDVEEEQPIEGDFTSLVSESLEELNLGCVPDKLHHVKKKAKKWIDECVQEQDESPGSKTPSDIYSVAISTLAEMTARAIEQFHKAAELILLMSRTETSALVRAQSLRKLTETIQKELSCLSTGFAGSLNTAADDAENPETVSPLITSVYLESANSVSYVINAFKLLQPVLQVSSVEEIQAGLR